MLSPLAALLRQLQGVLQSTGALQDVGIVCMAVALTAHLYTTKAVRIVHVRLTLPLCIDSIPAFIHTLDHFGDKGPTAGGASNTLELEDGAGAARCGVATLVEGQHVDVTQ